MERKIGEIFEYNCEWYQCLKSPDGSCKHCDMNSGGKCPIPIKECVASSRCDLSYVIFKKLEKVGEPMKIHDRIVLKVKADAYKCMGCCFYSKAKCELTMQECKHYDCGEGTKFIEIKQNKENMEEKEFCEKISKANEVNMVFEIASKYINGGITYDEFKEYMISWVNNGKEEIEPTLKEFDLDAAKAGQPVYTRNGHKARIICFDIKDRDNPIVAAIDMGEYETVKLYTINGRYTKDKKDDIDLMTLPEKKSGWVNVYKFDTGYSVGVLFDNEEEARKQGYGSDYIATVKVEWEE